MDFSQLFGVSKDTRITLMLPVIQNGVNRQGRASMEVQPWSEWSPEQRASLENVEPLFKSWFTQQAKDAAARGVSLRIWTSYPNHTVGEKFNAIITFTQTEKKGSSQLTYYPSSVKGGDGFVAADVGAAIEETKVIATALQSVTGQPLTNSEVLGILSDVRTKSSERRVGSRIAANKRGFVKSTKAKVLADVADDKGKLPADFWQIDSALT